MCYTGIVPLVGVSQQAFLNLCPFSEMCFVAELQELLEDLLPKLNIEVAYVPYMRTLLPGAPFACQMPVDETEPGMVALWSQVLSAKTEPNLRHKNVLILANLLSQPGSLDLLSCNMKSQKYEVSHENSKALIHPPTHKKPNCRFKLCETGTSINV